MIGATLLFYDGERALAQRLGCGVAALLLVDGSEPAKRLPQVGMVGAQCLFRNRQRTLDERLGLGVAPLRLKVPRQLVERATQISDVRNLASFP